MSESFFHRSTTSQHAKVSAAAVNQLLTSGLSRVLLDGGALAHKGVLRARRRRAHQPAGGGPRREAQGTLRKHGC